MSERVAKGRVVGADGVRALACLFVVAAHIYLHGKVKITNPVDWLLASGGFGVNMFFVLSGFLLSMPYLRAKYEGAAWPDIRVYFKRRLARIVPGFYLCILVLVLIYQLYETRWDLFSVVTTMTFTNNLFRATYTPAWNSPLWSIGIEMHFYVLLPLFALGLMRCRGAVGVWAYGLGVLIGICMVQHVFLILAPGIEDAVDDRALFAAQAWSTTRNGLILFTQFLFGFLGADIYLRIRRKQASGDQAWADHSPGYFNRYDLLAILGVVIIIGVQAIGGWIVRPMATMDNGWPGIPLGSAILLCVLPFSKTVGPGFDNRFLRWTAKLSYGIYIWHVPCIELVDLWWPDNLASSRLSLVLFGVAVLVASYVVALLSYTFIEKPVLDRAHRRVPKMTTDSP